MNKIMKAVIGAAAVLLAAVTWAGAAQVEVITFTNATAINTNLIANTVVAGGTWARVPQNVDGFWLLSAYSAAGALNGNSNITLYVDLSTPDKTVIVSNALSVSGTPGLAGATNTTATQLNRTNITGYAYWRVGKATTTQLTNVYPTLRHTGAY